MIRLLLLLAFITAAGPAFSQDAKAVTDLLEGQRQAWNRGDIEGYMEGYWRSDSLLFVGSKGPTYGWDATLANYRKSYPDRKAMGTLTFDIREVRFMDDRHAFVLGAWRLKREKDEPHGYFTLIVRKTGGEWKVIADHSS